MIEKPRRGQNAGFRRTDGRDSPNARGDRIQDAPPPANDASQDDTADCQRQDIAPTPMADSLHCRKASLSDGCGRFEHFIAGRGFDRRPARAKFHLGPKMHVLSNNRRMLGARIEVLRSRVEAAYDSGRIPQLPQENSRRRCETGNPARDGNRAENGQPNPRTRRAQPPTGRTGILRADERRWLQLATIHVANRPPNVLPTARSPPFVGFAERRSRPPVAPATDLRTVFAVLVTAPGLALAIPCESR